LVAAAWLVAAGASAQDGATTEQVAQARALFEEGLRLADGGRAEEAEDRFRRSLAIYPSPNAAFNLAYLLGERGEVVEATELYQQVASMASAPMELRREAGRRAQALAPRVARLTISLTGATDGVSVRVGHRELSPAALGVPVPIDPGPQQIDALRAAETVASMRVSLAAGQSGSVTLDVPPPPGILESPWLWTVVAVVVVGAAVGIGVGVALSGTDVTHEGNIPPGVVRAPQ
jgi:hypothetical protein